MKIFLFLILFCSQANAFLFSSKSGDNVPIHQDIAAQEQWLNTERPLGEDDLKNRIILLDFWTFCCINCIHILPDLAYLEEKFGNKLTVIGVHSAKFANEQKTDHIRDAILRYNIHHAVVNDSRFTLWQKLGVRAWPTLVLIKPDGRIHQVFSGEGHRDALDTEITKLINQAGDGLNSSDLPIALEKHKEPKRTLSFPGKMDYAKDQDLLFISDSSHHRILGVKRDGTIIHTIGSGKEGFKDGNFETAQFNNPQGVLYHNNQLYIADTENHSLRLIDLKTQKITTIAGIGKQGYERFADQATATKTPLASPWDLAFYPNKNHIAIAIAGTHQLWTYDIKNKTVSTLAGNGRESIDDGQFPFNSLSQPSGLSVYDNKLYFVDSETSSLRVFEDGEITTLIGSGLFDFGFKDGTKNEALMQHALGVFANKDGVFIADSYNHAIRHFDPKTKQLTTLTGNGDSELKDGALNQARFSEPNDLIFIEDELYILDTNNHALRRIKDKQVTTIPVFPQISETIDFSEALPNVTQAKTAAIAPETTLTLSFNKGWKLNNQAPSYLAVFNEQKEAIASFQTEELKQPITLKLDDNQHYTLQAIFYTCEDKDESLCIITSHQQDMQTRRNGAENLTIPVKNSQ